MDDQEYQRYEAIAARHYAREASTLTVATFTSAGALVFLGIVLEGVQFSKDYFAVAILFALLGLAYHVLTVFTIDHKDLGYMRPVETSLRVPRPNRFFQFLRWSLFRFALFAPVAGLVRIWGYWGLGAMDLRAFILIIYLPYPIVFSILQDC